MSQVVAPNGLPITHALRISYARASVAVVDGKLEWSGGYEVLEDRAAQGSLDKFILIDSEGNQWYDEQCQWNGVQFNLLANNS